MNEENDSQQKFSAIFQQIGDLHIQALAEYSPVVEHLLRSENRDAREIEHTLDGLLDFCGDSSVLELYRRLCRCYYGIAPAAAASYVKFYREMYDADSKPDLETGTGSQSS